MPPPVLASSLAPISRVAVLGAGQMGLGIALVSALHAQASVRLYEPSESALRRALGEIDRLLGKDVAKGKLTEAAAHAARARVVPLGDLRDLKSLEREDSVELIMEATPEKLDVKRALIESLHETLSARSKTLIGTNTSSLSISKLASFAPFPEKVIGLHWFNPVPIMKLVELIPALQTDADTVARARSFAERCGKEVTVSKDVPGFVANAVLIPFLNEAILKLEQGTATAEDIDKTFVLGMAHPMGPLKLADFIGLDTVLSIQQTLLDETGDSKYRPSVLLGRMVDAGWVGKKIGKGFYEYPAKK